MIQPSTILLTSLLVFICCTLPERTHAQVNYGEVTYVATQDVPRLSTGGEASPPDKISALLKEMQASGAFDKRYTLTFRPDGYLFRESPAKDRELTDGSTTVTIVRNQTSPNVYYTDMAARSYVNSEAIADRKFLHSGEVLPPEWTIGETVIAASEATLGFDLKTARAVSPNGDTLVAAFAPALPVPFGPLNYYGLPGAILQLDICNVGKCTRYRAVEMKVLFEKPELPVPQEGKKLSGPDFIKEREKYRARSGRTTITTYRN